MRLTFVFGLKAPLRPLLVRRQGCVAPLCSTNRSATAESTRQQLLRHSLTHWAIDPSKRTHSGRHLQLYFQNTFVSLYQKNGKKGRTPAWRGVRLTFCMFEWIRRPGLYVIQSLYKMLLTYWSVQGQIKVFICISLAGKKWQQWRRVLCR